MGLKRAGHSPGWDRQSFRKQLFESNTQVLRLNGDHLPKIRLGE